jgi:hypothetical protein
LIENELKITTTKRKRRERERGKENTLNNEKNKRSSWLTIDVRYHDTYFISFNRRVP